MQSQLADAEGKLKAMVDHNSRKMNNHHTKEKVKEIYKDPSGNLNDYCVKMGKAGETHHLEMEQLYSEISEIQKKKTTVVKEILK